MSSREEILKNNPKIKEIIVYDKRGKDKGFVAFISFVRKIRKLKIDVCLTPHRYLRSSILSLLSGASIRVGYDIASLSFVYNKKIKYDKTKHEVSHLFYFSYLPPYNKYVYSYLLYYIKI